MKTLKEFDYDLWAIEENGQKRYFARVKATREEAEISLEVMRLLQSQEKQMRRELHATPESGSVLSLDVPHNDEFTSFYFDNNRGVSDMETQVALSEFRLLLTEKQREVLESCLIDGIGFPRLIFFLISASVCRPHPQRLDASGGILPLEPTR